MTMHETVHNAFDGSLDIIDVGQLYIMLSLLFKQSAFKARLFCAFVPQSFNVFAQQQSSDLIQYLLFKQTQQLRNTTVLTVSPFDYLTRKTKKKICTAHRGQLSNRLRQGKFSEYSRLSALIPVQLRLKLYIKYETSMCTTTCSTTNVNMGVTTSMVVTSLQKYVTQQRKQDYLRRPWEKLALHQVTLQADLPS